MRRLRIAGVGVVVAIVGVLAIATLCRESDTTVQREPAARIEVMPMPVTKKVYNLWEYDKFLLFPPKEVDERTASLLDAGHSDDDYEYDTELWGVRPEYSPVARTGYVLIQQGDFYSARYRYEADGLQLEVGGGSYTYRYLRVLNAELTDDPLKDAQQLADRLLSPTQRVTFLRHDDIDGFAHGQVVLNYEEMIPGYKWQHKLRWASNGEIIGFTGVDFGEGYGPHALAMVEHCLLVPMKSEADH